MILIHYGSHFIIYKYISTDFFKIAIVIFLFILMSGSSPLRFCLLVPTQFYASQHHPNCLFLLLFLLKTFPLVFLLIPNSTFISPVPPDPTKPAMPIISPFLSEKLASVNISSKQTSSTRMASSPTS